MSRAFVKEDDGSADDGLAPRAISPYPNYVTARGLAQLRERLATAEERFRALQAGAGDAIELRRVDLERQYLAERLRSAIPVTPVVAGTVGFGHRVQIDDGERRWWVEIVGEDEAEPAAGRLSWVSPLARALHKARVGDVVSWQRPAGDREVEVLAIDAGSP